MSDWFRRSSDFVLNTFRGQVVPQELLATSAPIEDPSSKYLGIQKAYDPYLTSLAINNEMKQERATYEMVNPVGFKDVDDTIAMRRAIHTLNNYYNVLGIYRDDFSKNKNDKLARNAYFAIIEKATLDYIGTMQFRTFDKDSGEDVEEAYKFLSHPNPQGTFSTILKPVARDIIRYDAGVWVKSFNRAGYLTELKCYAGTEFWPETDRVLMDMTGQFGVNFQGFWTHGYVKRYWQRSVVGVYIAFKPEEICYFMMYPQSDAVYGTDFLKFFEYQIQYLIDSTRAAGKTFQNGNVPSMILSHPEIRTPQQLTQRINEVDSTNRASQNFGRILHLLGSESAQTISNTLIDMQWLEGQKFVAELIWAAWGFSSSEFLGGDANRATAYVKRNITKSRMLYPLLDLIEEKVNNEILPYLKGYKESWRFEFIRDMDLDDEQKMAQTESIRATTISTYLNAGIPPKYALRLSNSDDKLAPDEMEELEEEMARIAEMQMIAEGTEGDMDDGRYGVGSEDYSPISFGDYGQGGENTETRDGATEEKQFSKGKEFVDGVEVIDDKYFPDTIPLKKARIYIQYPSEAPKGREVRRGNRGGYYYVTDPRRKHEDAAANRISSKKPKKRSHKTDSDLSADPGDTKDFQPQEPKEMTNSDHYISITGKGIGVFIWFNGDTPKGKTLQNDASVSLAKSIVSCVKKYGDGGKFECFVKCAEHLCKGKDLSIDVK